MNGCVFIETRDKPGLTKIFEDHLKFVPELCPLVICSKKNEYQFKDFDKLIIDHPLNICVHNYMMTTVKFWDKILFDKVLICEHESGILREGIEEFFGRFLFRRWLGVGQASSSTQRRSNLLL